jgi:Protein of unknown function (DUF3365)
MKSLFLKYAALAICLIFFACDSGKKIDSRKVAEEMRNRKLKRVNSAQLIENTLAQGGKVVRQLDETLLKRLQVALREDDLVQAAAVCNLQSLPTDSLEEAYAVRIRRLALRADGDKLALGGKQREVWEAYRYNAEKQLPMESNVQRDGQNYLLYTAPILLANATCLRCHGKVGKDVTEKDFRGLRATYPAMDSLHNYAPNQPIGIWNLLFDKAKLVLRAESK